MKLIIDVSVEEFETLSKMSEKEKVNELSYYEMVIANGKPYEERPQGEWIDVDDYSKWLKGQTIVGFDYEHCEVLIGRNGIWESAIETYLKERREEE